MTKDEILNKKESQEMSSVNKKKLESCAKKLKAIRKRKKEAQKFQETILEEQRKALYGG